MQPAIASAVISVLRIQYAPFNVLFFDVYEHAVIQSPRATLGPHDC